MSRLQEQEQRWLGNADKEKEIWRENEHQETTF
jgi:hypothetical protein